MDYYLRLMVLAKLKVEKNFWQENIKNRKAFDGKIFCNMKVIKVSLSLYDKKKLKKNEKYIHRLLLQKQKKTSRKYQSSVFKPIFKGFKNAKLTKLK